MTNIDKLRKLGETDDIILETQCDDFFDFADHESYIKYYIFLTNKNFIVLKEKGLFNRIQVLKKYDLSEIRTNGNIPEFFTIKKNIKEEGTEFETGHIGFTIQFNSVMKGIYFHYFNKEEKKEKQKIIKIWISKIKEIYESDYILWATPTNGILTRYCINCGTQMQGRKGNSVNCSNCGCINRF